MKIMRHKNADRRERHLDAEFGKRRAEPAVLREQRRQRDAGDRGGQRKRHIDDGVEQPAAREAISHQRPDNDRTRSPRLTDAAAKARPNETFRACRVRRLVTIAPELVEAQLEGLEEQARERDQDDDREPGQRQPHGETEPRQVLRRRAPLAHDVPCLPLRQISSCKSGRRCRLRRNVPSAPWPSRRKRRRR